MIGAILLGLVAGFIGRALVPNDVFAGMHGPRSWLVSIVLGLVGAIVGWLIFTDLLGIGDDDVFDWGGLLSALIGVIIVLLLAGFITRRAGIETPRDRRRMPPR
ncbi:MAG: GlsB/YeaQ/YmgE family stress response membrane protein [Solirubrobacterales bacterium]